MDKIYDKLLFGVALLLVAASLAFYFMTAGGLPSGEPESSLTPTGPDYQVVPAPATQTVNASWPEPDPRGQYPERKEKEPWLYEVFTPPKIYIDR